MTLGNGFGVDWIDVEYFPIDEAHPGYSTDVYAFSKQTLESIAFYFWRCAGITSVCLRFPYVFGPLWPPVKQPAEHLRLGREAYEALMALPEVERQVRVSELKNSYLQMRQQRPLGEITFDEIYQFLATTPGAMLLFRCENF